MAANAIYSVLGRVAGLGAGPALNQVNLVIGVEKEIQILSDELKRVINVLDDAEKKGCKDKLVRDWLTRLENTTYEMDAVLDEWNAAILEVETEQHSFDNVVLLWLYKVRSFIPSCLLCFEKVVVRRNIALKVKEVVARLDLILAEKDRYGFVTTSQPSDPESWRVQSTSLIDLEEVYGRDLEREDLVSKLVGEGGSSEEGLIGGIRVISIVGVGGLGKTTLAQLAYNDSRVENCFELQIWICVSNTFDEVEIAKRIVEKAGGPLPNTMDLDGLLQRLKESISGKKVLLVLDDVWTEDNTKWEPLKNALKRGGHGSKVLVTTRNERVAKMMMGEFIKNDRMIHRLGLLNDEDCWSLFCRIALCDKNKDEWEEFENTGKEIAKKCKGLPLAAKTLGSLLRSKATPKEWESILNIKIWELEEVEDGLFRHLLLSYNELLPALKRCFSYCAVFPKDTRIDVDELIIRWMAMGYLGSNVDDDWRVRGRGYFDNLAMRSLFQDFERDGDKIKSFMMHDIVHDFAEFLRKNVGSRMRNTTCKDCSPLLVSRVEKYRTLFRGKEVLDPHVCDCLTSVRLLSLLDCRLKGIPKEIEKLIHLRWLDLGHNEFVGDDLKSICKLYNLQFLVVDWCELQEIPLEIGNLSQLIHLDLSGNKFSDEGLKPICNLYNLQFLWVDWCGLEAIPLEIGNLSQLIHLSLKGNEFSNEDLKSICNLYNLQSLMVEYCKLEIFSEIGNLMQVIYLDLSKNKLSDKDLKSICNLYNLQSLRVKDCELKEISSEIGNLSELIHLDLSLNRGLRELPESLCNLSKLESLDVNGCESLCGLPQGIHRLKKLKHLYNERTDSLKQYPQGIAELTSLVTLNKVLPCDGSQVGWLKNFNRLRGKVELWIEISSCCDSVEDARKAELGKKVHIQELRIYFYRSTTAVDGRGKQVKDTSSSSSSSTSDWNEVLDALHPHPNLPALAIKGYNGSRLPGWILTPFSQLTYVVLDYCEGLPSLPPLGKLPLLKTLTIQSLNELEYVGREFLGIARKTTSSSMGSNIIDGGFPKLKKLSFWYCSNWNKWEDITTAQEEEEEEYSIMPCLMELEICFCYGLTELPQHLLRKVSSSLKKLDIRGSTQLEKVYGDKEGQPWKSISRHNPHLLLF